MAADEYSGAVKAEQASVRERTLALLEQAQRGDDGAAEEIMQLNLGLVRAVACRFRDRGTEMEDLIQIGSIGMLRAIRSFDLSRGNAFSTYAVPLIIGEIRRYLRDDGLIRVSRSVRKLGMDLLGMRSTIAAREGREPRLEELAALCAVDVSEAAAALDAISPVGSLSEPMWGEEDGLTLEMTLADGESGIDRLFDRIALGQAIGQMPVLWQKIVLLRYFRDFTQQRTADALGLTQVKVSREEKKIVEFLRSALT